MLEIRNEATVLLSGDWDPEQPELGIYNDYLVGVFTSKDALIEAVNIRLTANSVLHYRLVDVNETTGFSWDWVYIPTGINPLCLAAGGGPVPKPEDWGKNLISHPYEMSDDIFRWFENE